MSPALVDQMLTAASPELPVSTRSVAGTALMVVISEGAPSPCKPLRWSRGGMELSDR